MAVSRYSGNTRMAGGSMLASSHAVSDIRLGIKRGFVKIDSIVIATGSDRLDTLAGQIYGDSRYWWVLAAGSDIGWGMQIPPGTVIQVPNLNDTLALM